MKFKVEQRSIKTYKHSPERYIFRTTLQILDGILMEAKNNQLKLTGTDLEISIETYLDCEIIEEDQ